MGSPLHRGVFGFVKRVQHKGNQMYCAAKFIPLRSRTCAQAYRERDILAELSHPLVTALLDQFETRKTLILILELYPALGPKGARRARVKSGQGSAGLHGACGSGVSRLGASWGQQPSLLHSCMTLCDQQPRHRAVLARCPLGHEFEQGFVQMVCLCEDSSHTPGGLYSKRFNCL